VTSASFDAPLVLIVDDNRQNLKLARDVLRAAGLRTIEAETGAGAIALAGEHLPDVVVMDLVLPDMHGSEATRKLKDEARTAQIPVLALSALSLDERDDWFVTAGFAGYLEKPIRVGAFPDQVRRFCTRTEVAE
jgi:two-component system cell cycle response regulator DivK